MCASVECLFFVLLINLFFSYSGVRRRLPRISGVILSLSLRGSLGLSSVTSSVSMVPFSRASCDSVTRVEEVVPCGSECCVLGAINFVGKALLMFSGGNGFVCGLSGENKKSNSCIGLRSFAVGPLASSLILLAFPGAVCLCSLGNGCGSGLSYEDNSSGVSVSSVNGVCSAKFYASGGPGHLSLVGSRGVHFFTPVASASFMEIGRRAFAGSFSSRGNSIFCSFPCYSAVFGIASNCGGPVCCVGCGSLGFPMGSIFAGGEHVSSLSPFSGSFDGHLEASVFRFAGSCLCVNDMSKSERNFVSLCSFEDGGALITRHVVSSVFFPGGSFILGPFELPVSISNGCLL